MSDFTVGCRQHATAAWSAAGSFPDKYAQWKKGPSVGGRAQRGCLGFLIFGIAYIVVPLMVFLCVEIVVVGYALLLTLLWGIGASVDAVRPGRRR